MISLKQVGVVHFVGIIFCDVVSCVGLHCPTGIGGQSEAIYVRNGCGNGPLDEALR